LLKAGIFAEFKNTDNRTAKSLKDLKLSWMQKMEFTFGKVVLFYL